MLANERSAVIIEDVGHFCAGLRAWGWYFGFGSSDSHRIRSLPIGYSRTYLNVGTDDPRALTPEMVRDATREGRSTISGGMYLYALVKGVGPGEDVVTNPIFLTQ